MKKALIIMSHQLMEDQKEELEKVWKVTEFVFLSSRLRELWSNIPPELESITKHLYPIYDWIRYFGLYEDLAIIQGDLGATYIVVEWARNWGLIPIYPTTRKEVREKHLPDGRVVQEKIFKHVRFRVYGK